jgi:AraC-like DNA-binding protein
MRRQRHVTERVPSHTRTVLLESDDIGVIDYVCRGHDSRWTACDPHVGQALILVRKGGFWRRIRGLPTWLDPGMAFLRRDEGEEEVAHPAAGGDVNTVVTLSSPLVAELLGGDPRLPDRVVFTSSDTDLHHRRLLTSCARGETGEAADQALTLVCWVLDRAEPNRIRAGRPGTSAARKLIVDRAREALANDPSVSLLGLSRLVSVSAYHLSRIFKLVTGQTFSAYRRRVRIRSALDLLLEGQVDLATVAAASGFADHAHLTRTFRTELGDVPSEIRGRIWPGDGSRSPRLVETNTRIQAPGRLPGHD